jgi:regulatory protein
MPRPPKRPNPERLVRYAVHHLSRYGTTRANLRRLLIRRVDKAIYHHPDVDRDEAIEWVDQAVSRCDELGLLDDAAFARSRVTAGLRRGVSPRMLAQRLAAKGVSRELVDEALADHIDPQLNAARRYVRSRRLGPWRPPDQRAETRKKDLARLGRAGFSYGIATQVLDEELED